MTKNKFKTTRFNDKSYYLYCEILFPMFGELGCKKNNKCFKAKRKIPVYIELKVSEKIQ